MHLGETIATYDLALALRDECGKFDVTSPTGETYHVTCRPNHSITNLQWSGNGVSSQPFLIRKVAEPVTTVSEKSSSALAETQARITQAPFLIGSESNDSRSLEKAVLPKFTPVPEPATDAGKILDLDVLYREGEADANPLTACVCICSTVEQDRGMLISQPCTTFNEFDAEIRRLHAQLDDIRYRTRKKFYQSQAVATGA